MKDMKKYLHLYSVTKSYLKKQVILIIFQKTCFFLENMYLKPMSCPGAALYLKSTNNNNENIFPKKIFEFGNVF